MTAGKCASCVRLDLQKSYNKVEHEILRNILPAMEIHFNSFKWSKSYLFNNQKVVSLNQRETKPMNVTRLVAFEGRCSFCAMLTTCQQGLTLF